jgi:type IV secretion system protein TrbI
MFKKDYPSTIRIRTGVLIGVISVALLISGMIVYNILHIDDRKKNKVADAPPTESSSDNATAWYAHAVAKKPMVLPAQLVGGNEVVSFDATGKPVMRKSTVSSTVKAEQQAREKAAAEEAKYMSASIQSNQLVSKGADFGGSKMGHDSTGKSATIDPSDPNKQGEKKAFLNETASGDEVLLKSVRQAVSPYELKAGTVIPGVMIGGINSDLPGTLTGQIRQAVYDSTTGNHLLLPQGAKLFGRYDSQVVYGQERVLVIWQRIIFPNGESLNLEGMPGVDMSGYAGFSDKVNNHFAKIFGSVLLMSVITSAAQLSQPDDENYDNQNPSVTQTMAASAGVNMANTMNSMVRKNLNIQPTLEIRPGYLFNITVTKDVVFEHPYRGEHD